MIMFALYVMLSLILVEMILRFNSLRYCPFAVRLSHAFGFLGSSFYDEWRAIAYRIHRSGLPKFSSLIDHYVKISGQPYEKLYDNFRGGMPWERRRYPNGYSGAHGVFQYRYVPPIGFTPERNIRLKTLSTGQDGNRICANSKEAGNDQEPYENILFLGGSAMFGLGSTNDEKTIPSIVIESLNTKKISGKKYKGINGAMLGKTAMEEALCLKFAEHEISHIIVLDGWNEVDQCIDTKFGLSKMNNADALKNTWNRNFLHNLKQRSHLVSASRTLFFRIKRAEKSDETKYRDAIYPHR